MVQSNGFAQGKAEAEQARTIARDLPLHEPGWMVFFESPDAESTAPSALRAGGR